MKSYTTLPNQPDPLDANKNDDIDFVFRNLAFTYDNAVALISYLADGSPEAVDRATELGDAFVYAARNDRTFDDGRLRTAYAAGDIALPPGWVPNGREATVPVPGFYHEDTDTFYEVEQEAVDVGNNAWAMIALQALYRKTGEQRYLETAQRLGEFVRQFRHEAAADRYGGFLGGIADPESDEPSARQWASTEHNLDLYAAFSFMAETATDTGAKAAWAADALHAREFVEDMWDADKGCFRAGTVNPKKRNEDPIQLPLDTQSWSILAIPSLESRSDKILTCAEDNHLLTTGGFTGFDFNTDRDGVWFEGTAQMALAYEASGDEEASEIYRKELKRAQAELGDGFGIPATNMDPLTTGFQTASGEPFNYYERLHVGATAWSVLAQVGANPFCLRDGDTDLDCDVDSADLTTLILNWTGALADGIGTNLRRDGDFDGDRDIDSSDLTSLIGGWTGHQQGFTTSVSVTKRAVL